MSREMDIIRSTIDTARDIAVKFTGRRARTYATVATITANSLIGGIKPAGAGGAIATPVEPSPVENGGNNQIQEPKSPHLIEWERKQARANNIDDTPSVKDGFIRRSVSNEQVNLAVEGMNTVKAEVVGVVNTNADTGKDALRSPDKSIDNVEIVYQLPNGDLVPTGKTLGDVEGPYKEAIKGTWNFLGDTKNPDTSNYHDLMTKDNWSVLIPSSSADKTLSELLKNPQYGYLGLKQNVTLNNIRHQEGDLIITGISDGTMSLLPIGQTADQINNHYQKLHKTVRATADDTRFVVTDNNDVLLKVGNKTLGRISIDSLNYALRNGLDYSKYILFAESEKGLDATLEGGKITVTNGVPTAIATPEGKIMEIKYVSYDDDQNNGYYKFVDSGSNSTVPEIVSVDIKNGTYTDANGNVNKIQRIIGQGGKPEAIAFDIDNTAGPRVGGILKSIDTKIVNRDGKDIEIIVATVDIPVNGKLVEVYLETGVNTGMNIGARGELDSGLIGTGYRFEPLDKVKTLKPGIQVVLEPAVQGDYPDDWNNTDERHYIVGLTKSLASTKNTLYSIKSGKSVGLSNRTFPGRIVVPKESFLR